MRGSARPQATRRCSRRYCAPSARRSDRGGGSLLEHLFCGLGRGFALGTRVFRVARGHLRRRSAGRPHQQSRGEPRASRPIHRASPRDRLAQTDLRLRPRPSRGGDPCERFDAGAVPGSSDFARGDAGGGARERDPHGARDRCDRLPRAFSLPGMDAADGCGRRSGHRDRARPRCSRRWTARRLRVRE